MGRKKAAPRTSKASATAASRRKASAAASSSRGSSSLSPVKSRSPSTFVAKSPVGSLSGLLQPDVLEEPTSALASGTGTPGNVLDEGALQGLTEAINEDVEAHLGEDNAMDIDPAALLVPDSAQEATGADDDLGFELDAEAAEAMMRGLAEVEAGAAVGGDDDDDLQEFGGFDAIFGGGAEEGAEGTVGSTVGAEAEGEAEDDDEEEEEADEDDEDEDDDDEDEEDEEGVEAAEGDSEPGSGTTLPATSTFKYPAPVSNFLHLSEREKSFKMARFLPCQTPDCKCAEMVPPGDMTTDVIERPAWDELVQNMDDEDEGDELRTGEGWWKVCGECGHGWDDEGQGHTWAPGIPLEEKNRRGKVAGRIEELLHDVNALTTFPTPRMPDLDSLFKQLLPYQRTTGGKKPALPLSAAIDMSTPRSDALLDDAADTPGGSFDGTERPNKRRRPNKTGSQDGENDASEGGDGPTSPRQGHGKKPGGKTASGKERVPRTVVRSTRGLIPMEIEPDGSQHVAGHLPDGVRQDGQAEGGDDEEEEEEEVPLAQQRPQLDEGERKRRELIKEKEREREEEVLRNRKKEDVEIWEGVELPKLPPRPAAIEQAANEIMLIVVASRNPTPVATILLIGLKNLFQKQLPKMPREYITRLVLDKNHISMAIVKKGYRVVGGMCYRPFESRGFAEIVFMAIDSAEQIKGYGQHLMNHIKDHVRRTHPTINHFLTYADNYAVGYFKKQGFTKEITYPRERWVGYIKDYEGGTLMQCSMIPKVRYTQVQQMMADQKAAVLAKIKSMSNSHIVYPGLKVFKDRKPGQEIKLKKEDVPGLADTTWNPDLDDILRQPKRNPHHGLLQQVLDDLQNEASAWPFVKPVDTAVVRDYLDVISEPMDLSTMESKLENNHYDSIDAFLADMQLIFSNCRQYNGEKNVYGKQANKLEKALDRIMKKRQAEMA